MEPISGFVTAAVGDVPFNFGKGVVIRLGSFPLKVYLE
jgi:hypothetical protein